MDKSTVVEIVELIQFAFKRKKSVKLVFGHILGEPLSASDFIDSLVDENCGVMFGVMCEGETSFFDIEPLDWGYVIHPSGGCSSIGSMYVSGLSHVGKYACFYYEKNFAPATLAVSA